MIRIAHTADIHARRDRMDEVLASLTSLRDDIALRGADLIIVSGDIWDSAMSATGASRFPEILRAIQSLADLAPVAMIYGTPSHDLAGSLEVFEHLECRHGVTVLRPGVPYGLSLHELHDLREEDDISRALILGIPEPSKEFVVANVDGISKAGADDEIREGMRRFLLGLAALRKQYASLPAIVAYHGQIAGATLQNGTPIAAGAGLAIGRDDLAAIGADYYALGDIHLPQQIKDLPAYYPGSVYPVDWGETHQCGWNLVTLAETPSQRSETTSEELDLFSAADETPGDVSATIERIPYPHPQHTKVETRGIELPTTDANALHGKRVWWEIHCDQTQSQQIDVDERMNSLRSYGVLEGSRVTLKVKPRETVRAADISEKQGLVDKIRIWEDQSNTQAPEGAYELARDMESEFARKQGQHGARIRIDRLLLRGAIGIWKGLHRDEIDIDFNEYDAGLIALIGGNGYGKTTLIENMQPWPTLITRDGKLADQFRLRDSRRELYFTDVSTDTAYKAVILIDSQSGNGEYHLYRDAGEWEPITNGRKDTYVEEIERIFGSLPMFLRSVFVSQRSTKGNPDLADATKGERKALFLELAGLDHLQEYAVHARESANSLESDAHGLTGRISAQEEQLEGLESAKSDLERTRALLAEAESELAAIETRGQEVKTALEAAEKEAESQRRVRERVEELNRRIRELVEELKEQEQEKKRAEAAANLDPDAIAEEIADLEKKGKRLNTLYAKKAEIDEVNARIMREHRKALELANAERQQLDRTRWQAKEKYDAAEHRLQILAHEIDSLGDRLKQQTGDDACPVCGQPWPEHKRAEHEQQLQALRDQIQEKKRELEAQTTEANRREAEFKESVAAVEAYELPAEPKPEPVPFAEELKELKDELEWTDVESKRQQLEAAKQAKSALAEIADTISETESELRATRAQHSSVSQELDPEVEERVSRAREAYEQTRSDYAQTQHRIGGLRSEAEYGERKVSELEELGKKLEAERSKRDEMLERATAWRYLEAACGRDGIQALELDALAPSIAQVANELLESAYGTRFVIEFETTRLSGTGSRQKQIESFDINVLDGETGTSQELKTLSGGEGVWIKKAIYDAFGIIRDRNTGVAFLTAFQDESDGALDPEAKLQYFRMLEAAHTRSGRAHTLVITHSPEVQQMIRQRISMHDLRSQPAEAVA